MSRARPACFWMLSRASRCRASRGPCTSSSNSSHCPRITASGDRWIDSNLIEGEEQLEPTAVYAFGSEAHDALLQRLVLEGRQGLLSLDGEILMRIGDENVLIRNDVD